MDFLACKRELVNTINNLIKNEEGDKKETIMEERPNI